MLKLPSRISGWVGRKEGGSKGKEEREGGKGRRDGIREEWREGSQDGVNTCLCTGSGWMTNIMNVGAPNYRSVNLFYEFHIQEDIDCEQSKEDTEHVEYGLLIALKTHLH